MAAVSDDEIIKRKLLLEGDGGNDDRRISSLCKTFIKWSTSTESPEESDAQYQRMLATLAQTEYAIQKSHNVYKMNLREQKNYEKLDKQIDGNIQDALEKISECKSDLHQAKRIRKNRQEYDMLAKVISKHPDRQDTLKQLEALDKEIEGLKVTKGSLEQKLEVKRKQFHVLISAIHEMQRILEEDEQSAPQEQEEMETT